MKTPNNAQTTLSRDNGIDEESTRSLLDHLLTESKLYKNGKEYKNLTHRTHSVRKDAKLA